ncbi:MAG: hypothetical protein ACR2QM_20835 [Longimicrobiales bacterium]
MGESLRRIRGVLGTAATWGAGWWGVGFVGWATGLFPTALAFAIPTASVLATVGAIAGAGFATLLGATERDRTLGQLSLSRMATWGALGGAAIGLPMAIGMAPVAFLGTSVFVAVLGATSATATVALAKSADVPDRLSPSRSDPYPSFPAADGTE